MSRIDTALTRLLDIKTPVVCAPMAGASGGALAAQVTDGGAFGFLGAGYDTPDKLQEELSLARSVLRLQSVDRLPIGVGYLAWQLEQSPSRAFELIDIALENRVQAIWLAFGSDLSRWVRYIREYDSRPERNHKTLICVQVSSVQGALVAISDLKTDILVAQGNESGGHGYGSSPSLLTLLSSILADAPKDAPPILAAGGLSDGSQLASLLVLGAAGVVLGTRFLLTPESLYTDAQKRALVAAKSTSTVRTMAFDRVRGTLGWPSGVDGRALYNNTVRDMDSGTDISVVKEQFVEGVRSGDADRMLVWAGTGVGLMSEIKGAKDIVRELHHATIQYLNAASRFVVNKQHEG
ncbi:hypothetical protein SERLA73DRAFT_191459 [Serpula lacrymans var. lacrymans S7.3]|uniref:Uncharacterized protein n=2 Tax=Serpula lacrymans var. lacrymans TaxID=341189 RepID=F8QHM7_SERL3|nr:uncharacterized protein SERLADRAFT_451000 [Serpula lacrymans var. lacrymans S7.9]EGN92204.1 hypothetical protein SERLA73DRAFT_191459 [Serpula lacrymans var. lacrymans S7.3]EGO22109.1 hypothetical protein SERLADRAFT_451000 [Serpula lacrymans var. lacrymans S7.9]